MVHVRIALYVEEQVSPIRLRKSGQPQARLGGRQQLVRRRLEGVATSGDQETRLPAELLQRRGGDPRNPGPREGG